MKLNRKLVLVLALQLSVAMATTGTLAYLSDTDADVNVMTLGNVKIVQNEQERAADGSLQAFTQNKPAYPAVGPVEWANEGVVIGGTEYKVFTDELANVIDKFVTVTNTGKSDAYVRTIVAIEAPDFDPNDLIHLNWNSTGVTMSAPITFKVEDTAYVAFVFTYEEALAAGETSAPSLMQLFLDAATTNEDVAAYGDTWEVLVLSQAVQTAGFADATTALDTAFGKPADEAATWFGGELEIGTPGEDWGDNNPPVIPEEAVVVDNAADLKNAVKAKNAVVYVEEGTYDMGGNFSIAEGTTIVGMSDNVVFNGTLTSTMKNLTIKNVHFVGSNAQRWAYASGDCVFENCTFKGTGVYAIHFDGISGSLTYRNCEIIGWAAIAGGNCEMLFENCTIKGNGTYGVIRVYSDATMKNCTFDVANVNTSDVYQDGVHAVDCTITMIGCTNVNGAVKDITNVSGTGVVTIK